MTVLVNVRVTPQERDEWKSRAQKQGVSLSDLIRFAVNAPPSPVVAPAPKPSPAQRRFHPDFKSISPPKKRKF